MISAAIERNYPTRQLRAGWWQIGLFNGLLNVGRGGDVIPFPGNQVISSTGFESPCSTKRGELPLLPFGNPIGYVPTSRGGVFIESNERVSTGRIHVVG